MEQLKEFNIELDVKKKNYNIPIINIVSGDTGSNKFVIKIVDNYQPYLLTNTSVKLVFLKPDGTTVFQDAVIKDINGVVEAILSSQAIAAIGTVWVELVVYGQTGVRLTTTQFSFKVSEGLLNENTVQSTNEFSTLTKALTDVNMWDNQFEQKYNGLEAEYAGELTTVKSQIADNEYLNSFKNDINSSLELKGTFFLRNYSVANNFAGLQGATIVNDKLYITCTKAIEDGLALLMEINLNTLALIRSAELPLYHANDITYNPDYNGKEVLIIPHTSTNVANPNTVSIVDISTFTILENKVLSKYVFNLSYDRENNIYIGSESDKINIFDSNLNFTNSYPIGGLTGNSPQGSEVYNGIYFNAFTKQNSLYLFDYEGKNIKKYIISEGYGELETCISIGNGNFILGFNNNKTNEITLTFYKFNLFETLKIENKSISNGLTTYTTKLQSIDIYVDCNYTGSESDGTLERPFKSIADAYSRIPTDNCYVDLFLKAGIYNEKVILQYFSGVHLYIQKTEPTGGEVKIFSLSAKSFLGEITLSDLTIFGTNNKFLTSTNNAIELLDVYKLRTINTKITNEVNSPTSRGIRTSFSNLVIEGDLNISNVDEDIQGSDNSNLYTNPTSTFTLSVKSGGTKLDLRASIANVSNAFLTAVANSYILSYGARIFTKNTYGPTVDRPIYLNSSDVGFTYFDTTLNSQLIWNGTSWDMKNDGQLPLSTGDVVTVVNDYISKGYKSGRILFSTGATNLPSGLTSASISFETFAGSSHVYLRAINFSITATKVFFGQINGATIVWKSATLA